MVMKHAQDYESFSQDMAWRLLAECSLDEQHFLQVADMCFGTGAEHQGAAAAAAGCLASDKALAAGKAA